MILLSLVALEGTFTVCRLSPGDPEPAWSTALPFSSITRTREETSIVCPTSSVPPEARAKGGWRCLRVAGTLDFTLVGILSVLLSPLAEAGLPVFVISTYDTDYLMINEPDFTRAIQVLREAGHRVSI
jgi:hypothetical protein